MSEASNGRVTITLGRSGQVVKRAPNVSDVEYADPLPRAGNKRSVRDRLGSNFDSFSCSGSNVSSKRQRGGSYLTSLTSNGMEDIRISKDDLRFKLMQKGVPRRPPSNYDEKTMDLRNKLSRTVQPPGPPFGTLDTRQRMPDPKATGILGRLPSSRSVDNLPQVDLSRNSYSPWTLDHLRSRSPDRVIRSSRGLSPPRNVEELQRRPLSRTFDDARSVSYMNKEVLDAPRPASSSATFMTKPVVPAVSSKPAAPIMPQLAPPAGMVQKSTYAAEEPLTVDGLLHSLGLGKYAILLKAEEVDMTALKQMSENDLKDLGLPMGPRKKILLALLSRNRRQP